MIKPQTTLLRKRRLKSVIPANYESRLYTPMRALLADAWKVLEPFYRQQFKRDIDILTKRIAGPKKLFDVADNPNAKRFVAVFEALIEQTARSSWSRAKVIFEQATADDYEIRDSATYERLVKHQIVLCQETIDEMVAATGREYEKLSQELKKQLQEGQKAGETYLTLSKRLSKFFTEEAAWRARRIAITESVRAHNYGFMAGTEEFEEVVGYQWMLSSGACDLCKAVGLNSDGTPRQIKKGDDFAFVSDARAEYQNIKAPPLHPNCRCTTTVVLDDDPHDFKPTTTVTEGKAKEAAKKEAEADLQPTAPSTLPTSQTTPATTAKPTSPTPAKIPDFEIGLIIDRQRKDDNVENLLDRATISGLKPEEIDEMLSWVADATPYMRMRSDVFVENILEGDGRFKSQFETGTSRGLLNTNVRRVAEKQILGVPDKTSDEMRPIYGFISDEKEMTEPGAMTYQYGDLILKLKKNVKQRSTITSGNSLNEKFSVYATPAEKPEKIALACASKQMANYLNGKVVRRSPGEQKNRFWRNPPAGYMELQVHGQLSISDIEEISINKALLRPFSQKYSTEDKMLDAIREKSEKLGIKIVVRDNNAN